MEMHYRASKTPLEPLNTQENGDDIHMTAQEWIDDVQAYVDGACEGEQIHLPVFFIRFSHLMLSSFEIPSERARLFGLATAFLTTGLEMHIRDQHRPMDVLSGDLFSMQFYCLLSEQGEVEAIRGLSRTISRMNEEKVEHYLWLQQKASWNVEALVRMQSISSALLLSLANFFREGDPQEKERGWTYIIPRAVLLHEVELPHKRDLTGEGLALVRRTEMELEDAIAHVRAEFTRQELHRLVAQHLLTSVG